MGGEQMIVFRWDEHLQTDHQRIDHENRNIIERAQALSDSIIYGEDKEKILEDVFLLKKAVLTHFEQEEMMQQYSNFSAYYDHKSSHEKFMKQLNKLLHKIVNEPNVENHADELSTLISKNYFNHIQTYDQDAAKYIMRRDYYHN